MKWILAVFVVALPAATQLQQRDFSKEDDKQAITFFREAVREQPNAGLFLNAKKEVQTCNLIVRYEQMDWVEEYSTKRAATLGKLGITPASANILKTMTAKRLVQNLADRIKNNRPVKEMCMYCICSGGMCGTAGVELSKIYQVGDLLDNVVKDVPSAGERIVLAELREPWKKSVINEAAQLKAKCKDDMDGMPNDWQKYGWECKTLVKALAYGIEPASLKLTTPMTAQLRAVNPR